MKAPANLLRGALAMRQSVFGCLCVSGLAYLIAAAAVSGWQVNRMPLTAEVPLTFFAVLAGVHLAAATWRFGFSRSAAVAASIGMLSTWVAWLYVPRIASHFHQLPEILGSIIERTAGFLLGHPAAQVTALDRTLLSLHTSAGWVETSVTWEKLDLVVLAGMGFWILLELVQRAGWRPRLKLLLAAGALLFATALLRLVALMYAEISANILGMYWNLPILVISYAPAVFLIARLLATAPAGEPKAALAPSRWLRAAPAYVAGSMAALIAAAFFFHPYSGRAVQHVIVDDGHSNWEWADGEFDEKGFGERATYGSQLFVRYLALASKVTVNRTPLDQLDLHSADVLILKTPTRPYSEEEKKAVFEYVRRGGGLLLVSDHTDLFGMSTFLNQIAEPLNLKFEADDQFELRRGGMSEILPRAAGKRGVMSGVGKVQFLTGCTMKAPLGTEVLVGQGMGVEPVDYSHVNFFGDMQAQRTESWGAFLQMAAVEHGQGRVVAFTDSTQMSNFCSTLGERVRFFTNTIAYAGDRGEFARGARATLVTLLPFAMAALLIAWLAGGNTMPVLAALAVLGGAPFVCQAGSKPVRVEVPVEKQSSFVVMDPDFSQALFPDFASVAPLPPETLRQCFDQFFACAARLGFVPTIGNAMNVDLRRAAQLMLPPDSDGARAAVARDLPERIARGERILACVDWSPAQLQAVTARIAQVLGPAARVNTTTASSGRLSASSVELDGGRMILIGGRSYLSAPYLGNVYEVMKPAKQRMCVLALQLLQAGLKEGRLPERATLDSLEEEAGFAAQTGAEELSVESRERHGSVL